MAEKFFIISQVATSPVGFSAWWGILLTVGGVAVNWGASKTKIEANCKAITNINTELAAFRSERGEDREAAARLDEQVASMSEDVAEMNKTMKDFVKEEGEFRTVMLIAIAKNATKEELNMIQGTVNCKP